MPHQCMVHAIFRLHAAGTPNSNYSAGSIDSSHIDSSSLTILVTDDKNDKDEGTLCVRIVLEEEEEVDLETETEAAEVMAAGEVV